MTITKVSRSPNIALIKYMGKQDEIKNIPTNASLSYTLNYMKTVVELTENHLLHHTWDEKSVLSDAEKERFIKHLDFIRSYFNYTGYFKITSKNSFPAGCGLASSASSFAALTEASVIACGGQLSIQEMANLSRQGSGSSCRSFFSPWALWREEKVEAVTLPYTDLIHHVVVVSKEKKAISSSESHRRVKSSLLFEGRKERAERRLAELLKSMENKAWKTCFKIIWQEFWDMHALFETAENPFGYLLPDSLFVLNYLREDWAFHQDGPWVTMDAGPNVHLLFREEQEMMAKELKKFFSARFLVL